MCWEVYHAIAIAQVLDPKLAEHLAHFGINVMQVSTDATYNTAVQHTVTQAKPPATAHLVRVHLALAIIKGSSQMQKTEKTVAELEVSANQNAPTKRNERTEPQRCPEGETLKARALTLTKPSPEPVRHCSNERTPTDIGSDRIAV